MTTAGTKMTDAATLLKKFEYWGEHPDHSISDWKYEIENDHTRLGYWDWVAFMLNEDVNDDLED
jgi:hypothetical protein